MSTRQDVRSLSRVEWLARAGYGARGLVYLLVGASAVMAALELRGSTMGSQGALDTFSAWPLGELWLGLLGVGLGGFAVWRVAQAVFDADRQGGSRKAVAHRIGQAISGLLYLGLALSCGAALLGEGGEGGGEAGAVLSLAYGEILLVMLAAGVLLAGVLNVLHGFKGEFRRHLVGPHDVHRWTVPLARAGYASRGVVFLLLGVFLGEAAFDLAPAESATVEGALQVLERQPFGSVLLVLAGAGLVAFGLFGLVEARFRRIVVPEEMRA